MKLLNIKQIQNIEEKTIEQLGIDSLILMERAGLETFYFIKKNLEKIFTLNKKVSVICGTGNNGGDGLVLARLLFLSGVDTQIVFVGDYQKRTSENNKQFEIINNLGIKSYEYNESEFKNLISDSSLIIDAIFGIGLKRNIKGDYFSLINQINLSGLKILSLDIPSGINAETGIIMGTAVKAAYTITYAFNKIGLFMDAALDYIGYLNCVDIGIPENYAADIKIEIITDSLIKQIFPKPRLKNSFKNRYGKSLFIGGSLNMSGAIVLSIKSALKSGLGLASLLVPQEIHQIVATQIPTAMTHLHKNKLDDNLKKFINSFDSIVFGPGIDKSERFYHELLEYLLKEYDKKIVIDADGLNILSINMSLLESHKPDLILTPHPGEFARLLDVKSKDIQNNRIGYVQEFLGKYQNVTLVLKGAKSIIANKEYIYVNNTGNPILARGGTGDILSGIIGALSVQGMNNLHSCILGSYIHGLMGDIAVRETSENSIITEELINYISKAFTKIENDIEKNNI